MGIRKTLKQLLLVYLALALGGCADHPIPDLKRLYESQPDLGRLHKKARSKAFQYPVIVVHGILGARLRNKTTEKEEWPGNLLDIMFGSYESVALPINLETLQPLESDLEAHAIFDRAAGRDFYGRLLNTLEEAGGFQQSQPGIPTGSGERRYYVFVYDWRQDNVVTARKLDRFINQIRVDFNDPDLKVDIIAHSMGGLIARYYLRYGTVDVLDDNNFPVNNHGASRVRKVILLGTPNLGSVTIIHDFLMGFKIGLKSVPTEMLATMPSLYQLLPHPINTWIVTPSGKALERDLFDVDVWRRFEWSIFDKDVEERILNRFDTPEKGKVYLETLQRYFAKQLERARRFVWSLSVKIKPSPIDYIVFGGDCALTPARVVVEEIDDDSMVRLYPAEIENKVPGIDYDKLMMEPGDSNVTKASLLARHELDPSVARHPYSYFPLAYPVLFCEKHNRLTGNLSFQNNLLNILLSKEMPMEIQR